ncbi:MAG: hypothetical protein HOP02_04730 [Methylococcaceae bacterium]|nr:hypothetical protein [Methylococcaceae bacterium]
MWLKSLQMLCSLSISLIFFLTQESQANEVMLANVVISSDDQQSAEGKQHVVSEVLQPSPTTAISETLPAATEIQQLNHERELQIPDIKALSNVPIKVEQPLRYKLSDDRQLQLKNTQKNRQYELHGSLNSKYVYLVVEKTGDRQIVGYLFDGKGKKKYIYGEWLNQTLQIYDSSNTRSTVVLNNSGKKLETDSALKIKAKLINRHDNETRFRPIIKE